MRHIAARWHDHHGRAIHDVVPGENHALFLKQVTDMIVDMARGTDRSQRPSLSRDALIVLNLCSGLEREILVLVVFCDSAHQGGTRRLGQ